MAGASVALRIGTGLSKSEDNFQERYLEARASLTPPVPLPAAGGGGRGQVVRFREADMPPARLRERPLGESHL